jgi:hypothetical protein
MTDSDSKFDIYLKKLIDLSARKMQLERATAATYRAARRDHVSVEALKAAMRDQCFVLKERSGKMMKAEVEKERATIAPPELAGYSVGLPEDRFGIELADSADVDMKDLIGK